jgi:hypothetical protein
VSGAQLFPVLLHHEDYFFACSHAASCLFPCAVTSSLARRIPFSFCMQSAASGHFPGACCVLIFFLIFLLPLCRQQGLPAPLSGHFEIFFCACRSFSHFTRAQSISFSLSGPSREWRIVFWCACRIFLHAASRHFSPCRVRRFFFSFWLCMTTCGWKIFYLVNSRGVHAGIFFIFSCSCLVTSVLQCAQPFCSCDQSLSPAQQGKYFFCLFRAEV